MIRDWTRHIVTRSRPVLCDKDKDTHRQCITADEAGPRMNQYFDSLAGLACRDEHVAANIAQRAANTFRPDSINANLSRALLQRRADHKTKPCAGVAALPERAIARLRETVAAFDRK